ncbi:hypothetical protein SKAU_G00374860 [Synaphobranchus kaupii]|uniref:Caspase-8 n=1 Tax=Synaphobranchus kaupii TaxID=118154 RepID=A0A9Q1IFD1_SYNKA|nr:hypothetical protein SKAU_G00374860 [Synaphobranchus kaupii]
MDLSPEGWRFLYCACVVPETAASETAALHACSWMHLLFVRVDYPANSSETERLQVLHKIDSELDSNDVAALKFLCRDFVPPKHLERIRDARDLFMELGDQGLLEDGFLIVGELLHTIQSWRLLRFLGSKCAEVEQFLQDRRACISVISPYRKMLYNLSEDVTADNLTTIKFLLPLPRGKLEPSATFFDVLVAMEKQGLLREDSLEVLEQVCAHCDKRLAARVQEFTRQITAGGDHLNKVPSQESSVHSYTDSTPHLSLPEDGREQPPSSLHQTEHASVPGASASRIPMDSQLSVDTGPESKCEEVYDMSRRPRGHCVIINNFSFEEAMEKNPTLKLGRRDGTDADVEALEEAFSSLHFMVHHRKDLRQAQMLGVAEEFGSENHGQLDAFVCCVLSHGQKGSVYATDGELVPIRQLTQPFTSSRCPSLAGKPKLFFIQACQLQEEEPLFQADGPDTPYDTDAGPVRPDTIPNDSDFLLGMATVEYHISYRHIHRGSIFIQELCEQLKWGCPRNEDILAILTKVNRKVSEKGEFKQMPEPRYTLRKKLILSMD